MRHCVHDGLRHDFDGNLVSDWCLGSVGASAHGPIDLAEDEIGRLIHQFEDSAPVHLQRGDGFLHLGSVKTEALDLGRQQESLRGLAEQHHGGVRGPPVTQQVQMLEKVIRSDGLCERKSSRVARRLNEPCHPRGIKIVQARTVTNRGIERPPSNPLGYVQVPYKGRVECRDEFVGCIEAFPDQSGLRPVHQGLHLGMPAPRGGSLHEDQAVRPGNRGLIEFALRRGKPLPRPRFRIARRTARHRHRIARLLPSTGHPPGGPLLERPRIGKRRRACRTARPHGGNRTARDAAARIPAGRC